MWFHEAVYSHPGAEAAKLLFTLPPTCLTFLIAKHCITLRMSLEHFFQHSSAVDSQIYRMLWQKSLRVMKISFPQHERSLKVPFYAMICVLQHDAIPEESLLGEEVFVSLLATTANARAPTFSHTKCHVLCVWRATSRAGVKLAAGCPPLLLVSWLDQVSCVGCRCTGMTLHYAFGLSSAYQVRVWHAMETLAWPGPTSPNRNILY